MYQIVLYNYQKCIFSELKFLKTNFQIKNKTILLLLLLFYMRYDNASKTQCQYRSTAFLAYEKFKRI